ncbi:MAG: hypothetical protein EPO51_21600 [Phenylobacterium sp.]|uniref:hypothetical protein n=1 Tax=Phenylobacterium sp. TaxID=1871053 RepID=UPI0011FB9089|nr:hypothetical protein [Phenylobacterium sp.]TAJ69696.1 MAG: hypothetical protein EPO51_21600 [Phenylobacterium sp.]
MKPIDFGKAALAGLLALILNLLATTAVIFAWAMLVEPGRSQDYYNALAPRIGAITGPAGGVLLLFGAAYLLGRRRPERNAIAFAAAIWVAYALLDLASGLPMMALKDLVTMRFALSLLAALAAALTGGALAARRNRSS